MTNMSASPITSVQPQAALASPLQGGGFGHEAQPSSVFPNTLYLQLRGRRFQVERETLANFPESVLVVMFPNGIVMSPRTPWPEDNANSADTPHGSSSTAHGNTAACPMDLVHVDFSPEMLEYILKFYDKVVEMSSPDSDGHHDLLGSTSMSYDEYPSTADMTEESMVTAQTSFSAPRDTSNGNGSQSAIPATNQAPSAGGVTNASQITTTTTASDPSMAPTSENPSLASSSYMLFANVPHPYFHDKHGIIVLREDLDYFTIVKPFVANGPVTGNPGDADRPPEKTTDIAPMTVDELKRRCGEVLLGHRHVFAALERNMRQHQQQPQSADDDDDAAATPTVAGGGVEQQLIDMLCVSGFARDAQWGCRVKEPSKAAIASLSLVRLEATGQAAQMVAAQKLLLFWKKPARKCWWDGTDIVLNNSKTDVPVRVWCRRTWTLELALV
ncbi:hypothetical protein H4R34_001030 [Dimargaris verticillata]|uniref:Phosphatase activator n=1 Tax=Dimargaris verticillata TaxID=2761393 RepID=A0A9W8B4C3_9FUNG|nr:hypothetical protein H4R34_001030 [Dimargaris verticillata]